MTEREALKLALGFVEEHARHWTGVGRSGRDVVTAIKEALAQPEQKYRRGNRLICLETEEFCVIHISGTDRQWVKFPDSYIGFYTNEQVAELFELLPKEPDQEPVAFEMDWPDYHAEAMGCGLEDRNITDRYEAMQYGWDEAIERIAERLPEVLYNTPPQRKPLSEEEIGAILEDVNAYGTRLYTFARAIEAAHGIKGEA